MARVSGIERVNRYPKHNKQVIRGIFQVEPKRGKVKTVIDCINETCYSLVMQETAAEFTVSDFFTKPQEVMKFVCKGKLDFLEGSADYRGYDIQVGMDGFSGYEGINPNYLRKHKDIILQKLNELDLVNPV